jgi:hypothetical protein
MPETFIERRGEQFFAQTDHRGGYWYGPLRDTQNAAQMDAIVHLTECDLPIHPCLLNWSSDCAALLGTLSVHPASSIQPLLADALQESGFRDQGLLARLRRGEARIA